MPARSILPNVSTVTTRSGGTRLETEWLLRLIARDLSLGADSRVVSLEPDLLWDMGETCGTWARLGPAGGARRSYTSAGSVIPKSSIVNAAR